MLKSDFHLHAGTDEQHKLDYTPRQLIDLACKRGYKVLSITNHDTLTYSRELSDYAKKRGILLIPGAELSIEGKEVLAMNLTRQLKDRIRTFADLERYKGENLLIIAPHPFYPTSKALHSKLIKNIGLFDAIEFSHFYLSWITFNTKAVETARRYKKPLVGTSDCHDLEQFGCTYSLVDAHQDIDSVFEAIRKNKVKIVTKPLPALKAARIFAKIYLFY
ncbi:hypothetical protein COV19_03830 [Candidatus Woesearchaeota archaeon CG10_big_fil_rev_8_21_14_0_10_44_13]|nr:MAG: hypothetical protein COV19_03830 [Candidatus Woesearchaeota archaeon CG10_big_fil_rev_8_21_14_0_10_44_13]